MLSFSYLKKVIEDSTTNLPSSKRWVLVVSTLSLCIGFLVAISLLAFDRPVSETVILGLAGILSALAGGSYTLTKNKESELKLTKKSSEENIK